MLSSFSGEMACDYGALGVRLVDVMIHSLADFIEIARIGPETRFSWSEKSISCDTE